MYLILPSFYGQNKEIPKFLKSLVHYMEKKKVEIY